MLDTLRCSWYCAVRPHALKQFSKLTMTFFQLINIIAALLAPRTIPFKIPSDLFMSDISMVDQFTDIFRLDRSHTIFPLNILSRRQISTKWTIMASSKLTSSVEVNRNCLRFTLSFDHFMLEMFTFCCEFHSFIIFVSWKINVKHSYRWCDALLSTRGHFKANFWYNFININ